jgi:hypothetical protein
MKWRGGQRGRGIPAFGGIGANVSSYISNFFGEDPDLIDDWQNLPAPSFSMIPLTLFPLFG